MNKSPRKLTKAYTPVEMLRLAEVRTALGGQPNGHLGSVAALAEFFNTLVSF